MRLLGVKNIQELGPRFVSPPSFVFSPAVPERIRRLEEKENDAPRISSWAICGPI